MPCRCYACRNYGECDGADSHSEYLAAKHVAPGWFYWGENMKRARGRRVVICRDCADAFSEEDCLDAVAEVFGVEVAG